MADMFFSHVCCLCCFVCIFLLNTIAFLLTFFFTKLSHLHELIWTVCLGVYYLLIFLIYLGLLFFIVKNSFDHVDQIITLKAMNFKQVYGSNVISTNIKRIFKHILLNLVFLFASIVLNTYFNSFIVKIPLILYISWTLGFTASFPINKDLINQLNNNQIKDYVLIKSIINTCLFLFLYLVVSNFFQFISSDVTYTNNNNEKF